MLHVTRYRSPQFRALAHAFEFLVVFVMLFCCFFTLNIFEHSRDRKHSDRGVYIIYGLLGLTLLLVPFTLKKVYGRWRKANADAAVMDIV